MQTKEGGRIFTSLEREKESSVKGLFIQVPGQFGRFDNMFPLAGFCKRSKFHYARLLVLLPK